MPTFLFDSIVFGPVHSRRLGVSLGINLLPVTRKVCSYNCIYCECGWTPDKPDSKEKLPSRRQVRDALRKKLSEMKEQGKAPDVITYAGNGEPTLHPDFAGIIDDPWHCAMSSSPRQRCQCSPTAPCSTGKASAKH